VSIVRAAGAGYAGSDTKPVFPTFTGPLSNPNPLVYNPKNYPDPANLKKFFVRKVLGAFWVDRATDYGKE
jgi:hypothetical protein